MIRDASDLLARLLDGGHSTIAGRLAGAFRNSGRGALADEITQTMSAAGYDGARNRSIHRQARRGTFVPRNLALCEPDKNPVAEDARSRDRIFPGSAGAAAQSRRLHETR